MSTAWLYFYPTVTNELLQVINYGGITVEVDCEKMLGWFSVL